MLTRRPREFYRAGPALVIIDAARGRYPGARPNTTRGIPCVPSPPVAAALALAALARRRRHRVDAVTLRWAGRGDMQTTDPHSQNENLTNNINSLIYEYLVARDKQLGIIPALAESWTQVNPTTWRFKLRPGVKFHDGTPFTADDVVFSFERAKADSSQLRAYANATGKATKIDDLTVEFVTPGPNPTMLEHVVTINIMSQGVVREEPRDASRRTTRRRRT